MDIKRYIAFDISKKMCLANCRYTQIYRAPQNLALLNMHLFYHIIFKEICDVVPSVTLIKFYDIFQHFNTQCFVSECVRL